MLDNIVDVHGWRCRSVQFYKCVVIYKKWLHRSYKMIHIGETWHLFTI